MTPPARAPWRRDDGSAVVEFVTVAVLLLVPLLYLAVALGRVQAATMAVDGAAREAARVYVTRPDEGRARRAAAATVSLALRDHGFRAASGASALAVSCSSRTCPAPGAVVRVSVELDVLLPGVPAALDRVVPLHVTVRARQVAVVDAFRDVPGRGEP